MPSPISAITKTDSKLLKLKDLPEAIQKALTVLEERKGEHLAVYHISEVASYTDWALLVTTTSDAHTRALVKHLSTALDELNLKPLHRVKRADQGQWVILDYSDLIIHLFRAESRARYNLEELYVGCASIIK